MNREGLLRAVARSVPKPACSSERGLVSLEWLLAVGLIAAVAASSVLVVNAVLEDVTDLPADPQVRAIDADIAAALIAREADAAALSGSGAALFRSRCQTDLVSEFADVVRRAKWEAPVTIPAQPNPLDPTALPIPARLSAPARCAVTLRGELGS